MTSRIDFAFVKAEADVLKVLTHYGIALRGHGVQRTAPCPFHDDQKPSFSVNLGRKCFQCFGCGRKGNILELVRLLEGLLEGDLRAAARKLAAIAGIPTAPPSQHPARRARRPAEAQKAATTINEPSAPPSPRYEPPGGSDEVADNPPLAPELVARVTAELDPAHPYLAERGLSPELIETFGLGFYRGQGLLRGRIAIPIHNERGQLVAFAGRWAGSMDDLPQGQDKYRLPKGFHKAGVLFNLHRLLGRRHVVVVEGVFGVFRLHALGIPAVALMGRTISDAQIALLKDAGVRSVTLLLDGDPPGRTAADELLPRLAQHGFFVRDLILPADAQPDTVDETLLRKFFDRPG